MGAFTEVLRKRDLEAGERQASGQRSRQSERVWEEVTCERKGKAWSNKEGVLEHEEWDTSAMASLGGSSHGELEVSCKLD